MPGRMSGSLMLLHQVRCLNDQMSRSNNNAMVMGSISHLT